MPASLYNVAFGCADAYGLARFWSEVVGHPLDEEDRPGDPVAVIALPTGLHLYFENVPEPKNGKNRVHVCLRPDGPRDEEVERLRGVGATVVADRREAERRKARREDGKQTDATVASATGVRITVPPIPD